ncbi:MAG: HAMP domain-containing histidine kinase [Prevotella sp.]|nr:HAMP domain-containing histidine kinase [Prevotella sp.]
MERRIKFIYVLTIVAIIAFIVMQGYWLYGRYQLSTDECEQELYAAIVESAEKDLKLRESMIHPPRQTCSKMKVNYRRNERGVRNELDWSIDIFMVDTLKMKLPEVSDSIRESAEKYGLFLFDYLSKHYSDVQPDGIDFHSFHIGNDREAMGTSMEAITRFYVDEWHPFMPSRLDSILRSRGIRAQSITTTKTDTMVWQPSMQPHTSIWRPVVTVSFPYDIFEGQQVVVKTAIGMSPIIKRMVYALLTTVVLSFFLVFCLVYQILTIRKQRHIETIRQEFLHTMIHELKRPIATLKMCVSFMGNERMMQDEAGKQRILSSSHNELDNLTSYFSKLRDITMSDAVGIPLVKSDFSLTELIDECIGKQNTPSGKEVKMENTAAVDIVIRADRMHIGNIICNLLENAIKYSREAVTIKVDYRLREDGTLQITVADNGIGIARADQQYVFDKFYRSLRASSLTQSGVVGGGSIPGIGLGLSYVKLLVEAHGGTITLASTEGEGTTFTILIPQTDGKD